MDVAPAKIMFVVVLSFEAALVSSPILYLLLVMCDIEFYHRYFFDTILHFLLLLLTFDIGIIIIFVKIISA